MKSTEINAAPMMNVGQESKQISNFRLIIDNCKDLFADQIKSNDM